MRLRSGIMYTLSNLADQGHVYATKEQLIKTAAELLEAEEGCVVMTLDQMLADHDLILQKVEIPEEQRKHEMPAELEQPEWKLAEPQITEAIYLPPFYYAETGVAGKLKGCWQLRRRIVCGLHWRRRKKNRQSGFVD